MVLIFTDSVSDPKTTMMLRKLREKNKGYNSLSRLDDIIVKYKNEVNNEDKIDSKQPSNTNSTKQSEWKRKK